MDSWFSNVFMLNVGRPGFPYKRDPARTVDLLLDFFFFSSRRRHTRCSRDWSSDVCSSDLRLRFRWCAPRKTYPRLNLARTLRPSLAARSWLIRRKRNADAVGALACVGPRKDRKSTRLNSSHGYISYAVFCLKKKNKRR